MIMWGSTHRPRWLHPTGRIDPFAKEHEQRDLVNATLKAENAKLRRVWGFSQVTTAGSGAGAAGPMAPPGMLPPMEDASSRKKRLDRIAKQLRENERGAVERSKWIKISKKGKGLVSNLYLRVVYRTLSL